jgi:hypothetical protein
MPQMTEKSLVEDSEKPNNLMKSERIYRYKGVAGSHTFLFICQGIKLESKATEGTPVSKIFFAGITAILSSIQKGFDPKCNNEIKIEQNIKIINIYFIVLAVIYSI